MKNGQVGEGAAWMLPPDNFILTLTNRLKLQIIQTKDSTSENANRNGLAD